MEADPRSADGVSGSAGRPPPADAAPGSPGPAAGGQPRVGPPPPTSRVEPPGPLGPLAPPAGRAPEPEPSVSAIPGSGAADVPGEMGIVGAGVSELEAQMPADPIDRICPYLRSTDGSWRAARPDPDHRCTSQQPPAPLPLLAQERFCLTSSHVRCEWFKLAEAARAQALERDRVPASHVRRARFQPAVRSVPVALAPAFAGPIPSGRPRRLGPLAIVVVALLVAVTGLAFLGAQLGGPAASPTPAATVLAGAGSTPEAGSPVATVDPGATVGPTPDVRLSPSPSSIASPTVPPVLVLYEMPEGERLSKTARRFKVRLKEIARYNPQLTGVPPSAAPGDIIVLPLPPGSSPPPGTTLVTEAP